ncbi:hypothetical protein [Burkholderia pseudomallei]|uniref:hypothetical protein n=1 Tax=Burkholderia pseudomallei TaxID=28450 RepID=UPI001EE638A8|nr:hypothetical protein [Burkholderia pseudomallei]
MEVAAHVEVLNLHDVDERRMRQAHRKAGIVDEIGKRQRRANAGHRESIDHEPITGVQALLPRARFGRHARRTNEQAQDGILHARGFAHKRFDEAEANRLADRALQDDFRHKKTGATGS